MPQVPPAVGTDHFCPDHSKRSIDNFSHPFVGNGLIKTRPATMRLKLASRLKQLAIAGLTTVLSVFKMKIVFTRKRTLCSLVHYDLKFFF
jgi:hypothetical protein